MITDGISLFGLAETRIDYLSTRHSLTAQNVANANTPGYEAKDLVDFEKALNEAGHVGFQRTHRDHLVQSEGSSPFKVDQRPSVWETVPSGNTVSLEQEMMKASEISGAHSLVSNIYSKHMSMLRMGFS